MVGGDSVVCVGGLPYDCMLLVKIGLIGMEIGGRNCSRQCVCVGAVKQHFAGPFFSFVSSDVNVH